MEGNYVSRNSHKGDRSFGFEEHTLTWGTSASSSWPARNYACSFCKREFKSAQALGGHMNVHRRDRARLRSSLISSWVSSDHHSTPKPNPSIIIKANNNNPPTTHNLLPSPSYNLSDALLNCAHPSPLYCPCLTLSSSVASAGSGDNKKPRLTSYSQLPPLSIPDQRGESKMNKIINTRSTLGGVEELQGGCEMGNEQLEVFNNNNNEHNNIKLELGIGMFVHPKENLDLELRLGHF